MAKASAGATNPYTKTRIRIVVAGDRGTGKSSLIVTAAGKKFPTNVQPVLKPTRLPKAFFADSLPITIIETSSRVVDDYKVAEELKRADAVVFTYACDEPTTLDRISTFWLPKLAKLEVKVPVIVVGCKVDLRDVNQKVRLEQVMSPIMEQFWQIVTCIECSALEQIKIHEVFYHAQNAVLHPRGPLLDHQTRGLRPRCVRALKQIFICCDHDGDGALNDSELNDLQVKCYNAPLQPFEVVRIKNFVAEEQPKGVNGRGLTLTGFTHLHALYIRNGLPKNTWTVLRQFGYNNDIKLAGDLIPSSFKRAPDQSVELTNEAIEHLTRIFELQNSRTLCVTSDGELRPRDIFSTAAESLWERELYVDAAQKNAYGGLCLDGFLSMWAFMTRLDPASSFENMRYVDYPGDPSSAFHVTRERHLDHKKQQTDRNVFQCFVFGPKKAGKSALLNCFLGRHISEIYTSTVEDNFAVNVVHDSKGTKKTLLLREISEDGMSKILLDKESLAACDVAVFVHDSSNLFSWERAIEMLVEVAYHGKDTGFMVPCLTVAAKDDLNSFPTALQNYITVSRGMGMRATIPISTKLGALNDVFTRIVDAAQRPHLSIPKTEAERSLEQYHRLMGHQHLPQPKRNRIRPIC